MRKPRGKSGFFPVAPLPVMIVGATSDGTCSSCDESPLSGLQIQAVEDLLFVRCRDRDDRLTAGFERRSAVDRASFDSFHGYAVLCGKCHRADDFIFWKDRIVGMGVRSRTAQEKTGCRQKTQDFD